MKVFAVPTIFLFALLALYGACRFTFTIGQAALAKSEEMNSIRARQTHALNSVRALLIEGKAQEAKAQLHAAEAAGLLDFYSLRKDDEAAYSEGEEKQPFLGDSSAMQIEAGPFALRTAAHWSWLKKVKHVAAGVAVELGFLLSASLLLLAARAHSRKKRPARKAAVRILREVPPKPLAAVPMGEGPVLEAESEAFECTLLRLQVGTPDNGEEALLAIAPLLETVRAAVKDVCARYGGQLSFANGHEFLCYFLDNGDGHSALLALSAARDLRNSLKAQSSQIDLNYALAHGFARLLSVDGQEKQLLGATILELNRLAVAPGQILVTERLAKFGAPIIKFKTKEARIAYSGHVPFTDVLLRCSRGVVTDVDGYHSDEHLTEIFGSLAEGWTAEAFAAVIGQLRHFSFKNCSSEVTDAFKALLRKELHGHNALRLSSLVALGSKFFTKETIDKELYALFLQTLGSSERRVKSNTIELFIQLYPNQEIAELKPYAKSMDNRISANVLIKRALERFDEKVVSALYGRVRGGSVAHVASALFALGEIAQHYKGHDPAALRSKHSFLRLFDEIPYWVKHPNSMVRRQALAAAKKLADPVLEQKLKAVFAECTDAEVLSLFESIYGWKKPSSAARRSA